PPCNRRPRLGVGGARKYRGGRMVLGPLDHVVLFSFSGGCLGRLMFPSAEGRDVIRDELEEVDVVGHSRFAKSHIVTDRVRLGGPVDVQSAGQWEHPQRVGGVAAADLYRGGGVALVEQPE